MLLMNKYREKEEPLSDANRHFYLYAKMHYKIDDVFEDMKVIYARYCAIEPEYIRDVDILDKLLTLVYPYMSSKYKFISFVAQYSANVDVRWKIQTCLTKLADTKVADIPFELGEPDPGILPLNTPAKVTK